MSQNHPEKTVLWISRHTMTPDQLADLERIMGGPVRLLVWADTVSSMEELRPLLEQADAVAAVLPLEKLAQLLEMAGEKPVLQGISRRVPTGRTVQLADGRTEQEFAYVHEGWQQLLEVRVRTKRL
ncbi:MAG: hypothetical protein LIO78_02805 [Clostridiales bacterium]|nr:hypothetical protein [Clostridiales bacterium]